MKQRTAGAIPQTGAAKIARVTRRALKKTDSHA
jgi:hypothetical protein